MNYLQVACEALIAAASKKDKCRVIVTQGIGILKKLYQSKNDFVKVRALVGLCKLGSLGGTDASMKPFADGAPIKLAEACRRSSISIFNVCLFVDTESFENHSLSHMGVCERL